MQWGSPYIGSVLQGSHSLKLTFRIWSCIEAFSEQRLTAILGLEGLSCAPHSESDTSGFEKTVGNLAHANPKLRNLKLTSTLKHYITSQQLCQLHVILQPEFSMFVGLFA